MPMKKLAGFAAVAAAAAAALLLTAAPAFAGNRARPPVNQQVDRVFARLDADHDGRISRPEAERAGRLANHFDKVDRDRDGYVTRGELAAAIERRRERRAR
jgi:Ca2+-binding EF-hand superfamily protein